MCTCLFFFFRIARLWFTQYYLFLFFSYNSLFILRPRDLRSIILEYFFSSSFFRVFWMIIAHDKGVLLLLLISSRGLTTRFYLFRTKSRSRCSSRRLDPGYLTGCFEWAEYISWTMINCVAGFPPFGLFRLGKIERRDFSDGSWDVNFCVKTRSRRDLHALAPANFPWQGYWVHSNEFHPLALINYGPCFFRILSFLRNDYECQCLRKKIPPRVPFARVIYSIWLSNTSDDAVPYNVH